MLSSRAHVTDLCTGPAFAHGGTADECLLLLQKKLVAISSGRLPVAEGVCITIASVQCACAYSVLGNFNVLMQPLSQLLRQCHGATAVTDE